MCTPVSDHAREQNEPVGHWSEPLLVQGATHWPVAIPQVPHSVPAGHGWLASHARPMSSMRGFGVSEAQLAISEINSGMVNRMTTS